MAIQRIAESRDSIHLRAELGLISGFGSSFC